MNNWYKDYLNEKMEKEASLKQGVIISLISMLSGVSAWFEASHIRDFLDKRNVPYEQFTDVVNNINNTSKSLEEMDKSDIILAKHNIQPESDNMNITKDKAINVNDSNFEIDDIVDAIIKHEGLIEGQTPFRITNPIMRKWNTIHGFEINKNANIPENRRNFIFLKNPNDVKKAVKQQILNYIKMPERYGLPNNPSLVQIIKVFDQSGSEGKIKYLQNKFPSLDLNIPTRDLL